MFFKDHVVALHDFDKTHSFRGYENISNKKDKAYCPHFWLPPNQRPTFKKVSFQLFKWCVQ